MLLFKAIKKKKTTRYQENHLCEIHSIFSLSPIFSPIKRNILKPILNLTLHTHSHFPKSTLTSFRIHRLIQISSLSTTYFPAVCFTHALPRRTHRSLLRHLKHYLGVHCSLSDTDVTEALRNQSVSIWDNPLIQKKMKGEGEEIRRQYFFQTVRSTV